MNNLTKASVSKALARMPERTDEGILCQVCNRAFPTIRGLGPHQLKHRREVGLTAPRIGHTGPKYVTCDRCETRMTSHNIRAHLQRVHSMDREEASMHSHALKLREMQNALPVIVHDPQPEEPAEEPPSVMTDLSASEAATGILSAARNDGLIPTRMLPIVHEWITHTEAVLNELRRLSDGGR